MHKSTQIVILFSLCVFSLFLVYKSGYRYQNEVKTVELKTKTNEDELCPLRNFVFVKTHKTGSSTMSNILLRYSENHKLNQLMGRSVQFIDMFRNNFNPKIIILGSDHISCNLFL